MTRERPRCQSLSGKKRWSSGRASAASRRPSASPAGLDVTVIDRLDAPGGKLRALPSAAGPVDAGPTVLTLRGIFEDLFAQVGARLSDHVTLIPEPVLARHWWPDGSALDLHSDAAASEAAIRDFAGPRAASEFRAFHGRASRLYAAFDAPMMRAPTPIRC